MQKVTKYNQLPYGSLIFQGEHCEDAVQRAYETQS